jgi:hypothetical protein
MADQKTPYSVLVQDKDLLLLPEYQSYGKERDGQIQLIRRTLGCDWPVVATCHGFTTFSAVVLRDLQTQFLLPRNLTVLDLLKIAPFECTWYSQWLLASHVLDVVPVEPLFKVFHIRSQYVECRRSLVRETDIAQQYLGICLNSNWFPVPAPLRYEDPWGGWRVLRRLSKGVAARKARATSAMCRAGGNACRAVAASFPIA